MCGFECTISTSIEKYIKVKCNYIKEWYFVSLFCLIGNSFGISLLNKTRPEDAHIAQRKGAIATAQWRAKRSRSLMSEGNRDLMWNYPLYYS